MNIVKLKLPLKKAIICKNIEHGFYRKDIVNTYVPKHGDVGIFKIKELGKHIRLQVIDGNNAFILPGDYILAAFGNRYASDQFEGYIPAEPQKEYHILGQGGAIGKVESMHQKFDLIGPTTLKLIGYVTSEDGKVVNTVQPIDAASKQEPELTNVKVVLSLGSSMDSGKTTTAGFLSRGLRNGKRKVAYIKLTGTVYSRDKGFVKDCGAQLAADFSDFGHPSTYLLEENELLDLYFGLLHKMVASKPDVIVVEIADGLYQRETSMLLQNSLFIKTVSGVLFSATDSLSAVKGLELLKSFHYKVLGISGLLTTSPLQIKETAQRVDVPVLISEDLMNKNVCERLTL